MIKVLLAFIFVFISSPSWATVFTDLKFSGSQIADTQWNVSSCLNTNSCQIYSKNIGPTWNTGSPIYPTSTQYIDFVTSGDATYPWRMQLKNADGSLARDLGTGRILVQGEASDGNKYFFFSNANYNGTLFSLNYGMDNTAGLTISGTNSPTVEESNQFASTGSTQPLTAGESGGGSTAAPTPIYGVSMSVTQINQVNAVRQSPTGAVLNIDLNGSFNDVNIEQAGKHYYELFLTGDNNTVNTAQITQDSATHFNSTVIIGSDNTVDVNQGGIGNKTAFIEINSGNNNSIDLDQLDSGSHFAEITLEGDNHLVSLLQEGSGNHMAEMNLVNNGGPWNVDLIQRGNTDKIYSLPHDLTDGSTVSGVCYVVEGCNLTLVQE